MSWSANTYAAAEYAGVEFWELDQDTYLTPRPRQSVRHTEFEHPASEDITILIDGRSSERLTIRVLAADGEREALEDRLGETHLLLWSGGGRDALLIDIPQPFRRHPDPTIDANEGTLEFILL